MGFLGIRFKKQSAEEKYEAFTDKGKWKIAFGLIAQTLLRSGPIRFKIFFSALYLILYAVSIVFFRKSPAELKKIKESFPNHIREFKSMLIYKVHKQTLL